MSDASPAAPAPAATPTPTPDASPANEKPEAGPEGGEKAAPKKIPLEPAKAKRIEKITVDGVEEEVDIDEVLKNHQKYKSGDKALKEAALQKKQVSEFLRQLKEDPRKVLSNPKLGIDLRKIGEDMLREEIEREMEDPKERRLKELEAEKKQRDDADNETKTSKEKEEYDNHVSAQREEIAGKITDVLKGTALSKDAMTMRGAAYYMRQCLLQGIDVTPAQIVQHLETTHLKNLRDTANQYDASELVSYLGPDVIRKLREHDLAELRKARGIKNEQKVRKESPEPGNGRAKESPFMDRFAAADHARKKLGI